MTLTINSHYFHTQYQQRDFLGFHSGEFQVSVLLASDVARLIGGRRFDATSMVEVSIKNDTSTLVHGTITLYRNVGHLSATDAASHPKRNRSQR